MKTARITVRPSLSSSGSVRIEEGKPATVRIPEMIELYQENDKIMLKETGEIFTVDADLSNRVEPGIVVKENIGRLLLHCEVRPAGQTREKRDAVNSAN